MFLLQRREHAEATILKFCVLASGSAGNSTLIATDRTRLLVDAGLSGRELTRRLSAIGEQIERVSAILITHEHGDHVAGLPVIAKKFGVPVYTTALTAPTICWNGYQPVLETFRAGERIAIGDIDIETFTIPHDATDPVGFTFQTQGLKLGMVTDLGYIPDSIRFHLRGTDLLMLESNHDLEMLKVGPYPWPVKQRVMGRKGHLSNETVANFIRKDMDSRTAVLVLGHLSEHNNHPELARNAAARALGDRELEPRLLVAEYQSGTEVIHF